MPSPQQGSWEGRGLALDQHLAQACQQAALPKGGMGLYLAALGIVGKVALAGKPSGSKRLPGVGVLRALQEEHRQGSGGAPRGAHPLELHKTCKAQPRPFTLLAGAVPKLKWPNKWPPLSNPAPRRPNVNMAALPECMLLRLAPDTPNFFYFPDENRTPQRLDGGSYFLRESSRHGALWTGQGVCQPSGHPHSSTQAPPVFTPEQGPETVAVVCTALALVL